METEFSHEIDVAYSAVNQFINSIHPLPDEEWLRFKEFLKFQTFSKGEVLTALNSVEQKVYFLLDGMVRVYAPINGLEHSTNFRFTGQFTSSITSFISRKPSLYVLEALADIQCFTLSYDNVQDLYNTCPNINTLGRKIIEGLYIEKHYREMAFLSQSAETRYHQMIDKFPEFIYNIPLKHLASYLGVSPETLSRIRSKVQ